MSARHHHDHGLAGRTADARDTRRRLGTVLAVTSAILVCDLVGALVSGSLALLADAGHVLTDAAGLALALIATVMAARPPTDSRTWGFRRAEVLAAAAQAAVLLAVGLGVLTLGVRHLVHAPPVSGGIMVIFGSVALVGNLLSAWVLARSATTLLTRAARLEVANDALGSAAVVVAALVVATTGFRRADAVASIVIAVLILPRTWSLLRDTVDVLLESTPRDVNLATVRTHLLGVKHVLAVHDLHASSISSDLPVLTAHVVVQDSCFLDGHCPQLLDELQSCLAGHFDVAHSTFQLERAEHAAHEHPAHD